MKRILALCAAAILLGLGACSGSDASDTDLAEPKFEGDSLPQDYSVRTPDRLIVFQSVDDHATVVFECILGLGFRSVSTTHQQWTEAVTHVPEWDELCPPPDPYEPPAEDKEASDEG